MSLRIPPTKLGTLPLNKPSATTLIAKTIEELMKVDDGMPPSMQRPLLQTLATFPSQTCRKRSLKLARAAF